jgi:hypothetical protein
MTGERPDWLVVERRDAPLIVSTPHAGTELLGFEPAFVSPWLARKDADWRLDALYDFVASLGATLVRTRLSRSIIDVNRDPSGASLYPGQATTELVPTTTFDGQPLYRPGRAPGAAEIAERRRLYFDSYHAALASEIARLRQQHKRIALFDAHCPCSISVRVPARAAALNCARQLAPCSPQASKLPSSMGASRAAGSYAPMGGRAKASRLCSSNSLAEPTCRSPTIRHRRIGQRRSTKSAPRRRARQSSACLRRCFRRSASHDDVHAFVIPDGSEASDRESSALWLQLWIPGRTFGPPRMTSS